MDNECMETRFEYWNSEELLERARTTAKKLQLPGVLDDHFRDTTAKKQKYKMGTLKESLVAVGFSIPLIAVGLADQFGGLRLPGIGLLSLIGGILLGGIGVFRALRAGLMFSSTPAERVGISDPVELSATFYRSALHPGSEVVSIDDRLAPIMDIFPPGVPTPRSLGHHWELCCQEIKAVMTGSAEPNEHTEIKFNVKISIGSGEAVGSAVVSLVQVTVDSQFTVPAVCLSNASIRLNNCCFLLSPEPGQLVSLSRAARDNIKHALKHRMASTRDVARRCLAAMRDTESRKTLQEAVAREEVPWVKANMEAALKANLNESNDEHTTEPESTKIPCSNCGSLIRLTTAERTGGFCTPCTTGRRRR